LQSNATETENMPLKLYATAELINNL